MCDFSKALNFGTKTFHVPKYSVFIIRQTLETILLMARFLNVSKLFITSGKLIITITPHNITKINLLFRALLY